MFKVVISGFFFFMGSIWTLSTLWQSSSCERVAAFAAPLEWVATMGQVAAEPLTGYEEKTAAERAVNFQGWAKNFVAKWVYSRDGGYEQLCKSDPVYVMKTTGLLDHRNLLKKELYGKPLAVQFEPSGKTSIKLAAVQPKASAQAAREAASLEPIGNVDVKHLVDEGADEVEQGSSFGVKIAIFLALLALFVFGLFKFMAADNKWKAILENVSKPVKDVGELSTHLMGRDAIRPDAGPKATDNTK